MRAGGKLRPMSERPRTRPARAPLAGALPSASLLGLLGLLSLAPLACLEVPADLETPEGKPAAPSTVQELLDRHVAASGGEEALRELSQRTVEARVLFKPQEGCQEGDEGCIWEETTGQFVLYSTADGRMYRRMVVGDNVLERGFDGETGWQMQSEPQMLVLEDPAATPVLREDALLHWYLDVDAREVLALELLPSRKVETEDGVRELDGVRWFAAGPASPESEKWFDRETGLLYEEIERDTESGDLVRRVYTDYREVDGVSVPWVIQQITEIEGYPDQVIELRMQVVHHREVRDELFAVPDPGPVEPVPDQWLSMLEQARGEAEASPDSAAAQVTHARVAFATAHFDEAREAAEAALKLDKKEIEALYTLARIELLENDLRAAKKHLEAAYKSGLRGDLVVRQLAWINLREGDWKGAAENFDDAGFSAIASRYRNFEGKPLQGKMTGKDCVTRLPYQSAGGDVIVVEVGADGETLNLLLDTGASDLIISDAMARSLVIATDAEAPLAAGGPALPQGRLDKLSLGELEVRNVPVTMFPADQLGAVVGVEGADGVLGIRPFAGRQLTVDRQAQELEIVDTGRRCKKALEANRAGASLPFWLHETHYLYVLGHMNGAEGVYLLNTGMSGADLTANDRAYAHAGVGAPPIQPGKAALAEIESFSLGGHEITGLGAAFGFLQQDTTSDGFRLDGMLGLDALGQGRWTLDFEEQRLYLSAPKPAEPKAGKEAKKAKTPKKTK